MATATAIMQYEGKPLVIKAQLMPNGACTLKHSGGVKLLQTLEIAKNEVDVTQYHLAVCCGNTWVYTQNPAVNTPALDWQLYLTVLRLIKQLTA